ncbi:MAG: DUF4199 domain-containing protein [Marinilabiliaceae bacterium]|nr:DUF4199 domain-containing protein [Marinilabiliaceae bacterium]
MNWKFAIKLGCALTLVAIVKIIVSTYLIKDSSAVSFLFFLIELAVLILGLRKYKRTYTDKVFTFGAGMELISIAYLIVSFFSSITIVLIYQFDTDVMAKSVGQIKQMIAQTGATGEAAQTVYKTASAMLEPIPMFITQFLGAIIGGLIVGAIVMAFMREKETIENVKTTD